MNFVVVEMKTWFKFFDKNNDKLLDKEELKMVFHALCWTVNEEEVDRLFKLADTDRKPDKVLSTFRLPLLTFKLHFCNDLPYIHFI
jgi:Ca2+-binding EF-hand superfamily protein